MPIYHIVTKQVFEVHSWVDADDEENAIQVVLDGNAEEYEVGEFQCFLPDDEIARVYEEED